MKLKILNFFERDKDITVSEEWSYIYITIKETFKILIQHYGKKANSTTNNL